GKQEEVDRLFKLFEPRLKLGKLFLGELTQLGVGERLLILADLLLRLEEFVISLDELVQVRALAAQLRETLPIGRDLGSTEELLKLAKARDDGVEFLPGNQRSAS